MKKLFTLALIACGRMTGIVYQFLYPWDYAAGWLIVSKAGGKRSLVSGNDPTMHGLSVPLLATNGLIYEELKVPSRIMRKFVYKSGRKKSAKGRILPLISE